MRAINHDVVDRVAHRVWVVIAEGVDKRVWNQVAVQVYDPRARDQVWSNARDQIHEASLVRRARR